MNHTFKNRQEAGRRLAAKLSEYADDSKVVVLGLPRGGVVPAHEIAKAIGAPMDICLVRKLGVPGRWELAMGAVATGGVTVLNSGVIQQLGISQFEIEEVAEVERRELKRREDVYRRGRPPLALLGSTCILVDDGLATGATMRAAVQAARARQAATVVVAVAVAAPDSLAEIEQIADRVICLLQPPAFEAVGLWYEQFDQVTDEAVCRLLDEQRAEKVYER